MHPRELVGVDEVPGGRQFRRVHGDDVGPAEQLVELDALDAKRGGIGVAEVGIGDGDEHVERRQPLDDEPADRRRPDHADAQAACADVTGGSMARHRLRPRASR